MTIEEAKNIIECYEFVSHFKEMIITLIIISVLNFICIAFIAFITYLKFDFEKED